MASTWLALDPQGPRGQDASLAYGTGWAAAATTPSGQTVHFPSWNHSLVISDAGLAVNGTLGDPVDGDGLSPGFVGGVAGFAWSPGPEANFEATSQPTLINDRFIDSLFLGHFVLTDPDAEIVGADLLVTLITGNPINPSLNARIPLDGSPGLAVPESFEPYPIRHHIEYERTTFTNSLGTFTALDMYLVPAPAALPAVLAAALPFRPRRSR